MRRASVVVAGAFLAMGASSASGQTDRIIGSWHGTSRCVDKVNYPACNDEQVIYDARAKEGAPGVVLLRADKVVNGARDFMGEFEFTMQSDSSWVADFRNSRVHIRIVLHVSGPDMEGTMSDVLQSGRRIREMRTTRRANTVPDR